MNNFGKLNPEDYLEPDCPLSPPEKTVRIPQQRISEKLDELMAGKDYSGAERMLEYWISEAEAGNDMAGKFMVYNEMMGFYRKTSQKEKGYAVIDKALGMLDMLGYRHTVSGATAFTNAATVYTAFADYDKAIGLFEKARLIYEANLRNNEFKAAGLYNNMAIALVALKRYDEAEKLYQDALQLLQKCEHSELEQALTWLNMVDLVISRDGINEESENRIVPYMYNAQLLLDDENVLRDDYYAFVCDKCFPIYEYFGWTMYADELKERIRQINERS